MTKLFAALTILFLLATAGLYLHMREVMPGPYALTPYESLRPKLEILQRSLETLEKEKPAKEDFVRVETTRNFLRTDIEKLRKEMLLRQVNVLLALATLLCGAIFGVRLFIRLFRGGSSYSAKKGKAYHSGKIQREPSRVEYINPDDLVRRMTAGYVEEGDAESWLRSDEFLHCPHCHTPVEAEAIGSLQEVVFYEEAPKHIPKDQIRRLGSVWVAKPKDRFPCKKCGRELIRSAR